MPKTGLCAVATYPYLSGDGVPVARPLFQEEGDGAIPISPLQLRFSTTDTTTAMQLNALWHSRLPRTHKGNIERNKRCRMYVAEFENRYYATAIWTDPVAANRLKDGWLMLELRRYAISPNAPKNTATRMMSWMVKDIKRRYPELVKLISYQDCDVHTGTIYKASGWVLESHVDFVDWGGSRQRAEDQSKSAKHRWGKDL